MKIENLTLTGIDQMRHLVVNERIITAAAFATRTGRPDATVYRFVVALVLTDSLERGERWSDVLEAVDALVSPPVPAPEGMSAGEFVELVTGGENWNREGS